MWRAVPILLAMTLGVAPALARNVGYGVKFVNNIGCHVVQVDLNSPWAKVTPITSLRFPGGAEPMMKMCGRLKPAAAVTGTFFSKTSLLPIGDIVRDGRLVYFGGMGTAVAITPENVVAFEDVEYGRHQDWGPFETVLACGPRLLRSGNISLAPRHQGFSDPHVLGRASRVAVGLTPANKLLMVVTRQDITLTQLANLMLSLGCIDAINLDGGSSTGMYYRGKGVVMPARSLVNMLAVYESVEHETRTCNCELPAERESIYQWRAARAYQVYMRAQTPLAQGDLDESIRLLEIAAGLDEFNASYQARLAETLASRGDLAAASAAYARAGVILADKNALGDAAEHMRKALDYNPDNPIAQSRLPSLYREQGMDREARAAEYTLKLRELEESVVAAHTDLIGDIVAQAWALAGGSVAAAGSQPRLAEITGRAMYVDGQLGVALQPPVGWEVAPGADAGALIIRHRFEPLLAHLRVVRVPEHLDMDRFTELYYARSFQHDLYSLPAAMDTTRVTRATEVVSIGDRLHCETLFSRRGELVWILSFTCSTDVQERAIPDAEAIMEGFTLFRS